jgi:hypothetical protein
LNHFIRHNSTTKLVAALALFDRHIEEYCLDICVVQLREFDERPSIVNCEVGRVDVRDRPS